MKILGVFVVAFGILITNKILGFEGEAGFVGLVIGTSVYVLSHIPSDT